MRTCLPGGDTDKYNVHIQLQYRDSAEWKAERRPVIFAVACHFDIKVLKVSYRLQIKVVSGVDF